MSKARLGLQSIEREAQRLRTLLREGEGVAVYNSGAITIPNITVTALSFDSERQDDADFHSTSSDTSRLTVPTGYAGWYVISGCVRFEGNAGGTQRLLSIKLNGSTEIQQAWCPPRGALNTRVSIATPYYLAEGDYVELVAYQDSGGDLDAEVFANVSPEFRMVKI